MKVELLTENLKKAINNCEKITRKTLNLPVLQNVLMETKGNFLELNTTNLETTIRWWILAKIEKKGKLVVPATFLANLVNLINEEKIGLSEENGNLVLTTKNQRTRIQGQKPEDFPVIPKIEREVSWQIPIHKVAEGLGQVIDVTSSSQVRPEISGVYFYLKKKILKMVGTDSFRLAEKTIDLEDTGQKEGSFILPQSSARELFNILSQEEGKANIFLNQNQVLFELLKEETSHPQINLLSRLIEGEYPNYQEIIPKKHTTKIQVEKESFENQIKKAGLFSGKVLEVKITALPKDNKLKVFSQSIETGQSESELSSKIEGERVEISFNYRFLLDGFNNIKSSEVVFELNGEEGAGVLKPVGDESYIYILMPIKAS